MLVMSGDGCFMMRAVAAALSNGIRTGLTVSRKKVGKVRGRLLKHP